MVKRLFVLNLFVLSLVFAVVEEDDGDFDPATLSLREVLAERTQTPPKIDGDVSDNVWGKAEILAETATSKNA